MARETVELALEGAVAEPENLRILDFDVETLAAGFADPSWVPQKITCVAYSWIGEENVWNAISGPEGFFYDEPRREMLHELLVAIRQADIVTGHNIVRFDLPVVNAEALRLGLTPLESVYVDDTMSILKSKGFKKGQDNISQLLGIPLEKQAMTWQQWQDAYSEQGWPKIRSRAESDVLMHKLMRERMRELGWLHPPRLWKP